MWLIAGLFAFALLERLLSSTAEAAEDSELRRELAQEDEDSDTQNNNNDPCDKKRQEKKELIKGKNSAPSSQLSLLNPFHGMSSTQVRTTFPVVDKRGSSICLNKKRDNTRRRKFFFPSKQVTGYLNLLANGIDNFTHGLAVAGSFLVSTRVGLLTTAAILLHEIPHEVADFAILLRAGTYTILFFFFFLLLLLLFHQVFIAGILIKIAVF
jgi:zinc transporter 13